MARIVLTLILFGSLTLPIPNNSTSQSPEPSEPLSWSQWGMNPQHTGMMPVAGQRAEKVFADILIDRHVNQEIKNSGGIPVHYQSALVDGDDVFLEFKAGQYTGPENWNTQSWGEMRYQWKNNRLVKRWSFLSDWKPVPNGPVPHGGPGFEPVCGSQRPGINIAPAIAPDGTIYTISRSHFNDGYGYVVAATPNLKSKWIASLRGHLRDGCGVIVPIDGSFGGCIPGTRIGVDPSTNEWPAGRVYADDTPLITGQISVFGSRITVSPASIEIPRLNASILANS